MTNAANAPIRPATPAPASTPAPTPSVTPTSAATSPTPRTAATPTPAVQQAPAPMREQYREPWSLPYMPVQLIFLTGRYKGLGVDLGLAVNELSHAQQASWEDNQSEGIRVKLNFKRLSSRDISFEATYASIEHDVICLPESIAHLQEIATDAKQPPYLLLTQGSATIGRVVCSDFQAKYSDPHPIKKGFRKCAVTISLKLDGGKNDPNALGVPLVATPLSDEADRQTAIQRQQEGTRQVNQILLAPCLGEQGSAAISTLIEQETLGNIDAVLALDSNTLVQGAIAGLFTTETLQNERVLARLRQDLARVMSENESGVNPLRRRAFGEALLSGNVSGLTADLQQQAIQSRQEYQAILDAITTTGLTEDATVFEPDNSAGEKLRRFGACGLQLRNNGGDRLTQQGNEPQLINEVNAFLATNPTNDQIGERFGVTTESQINTIRNGHPYQSKTQFTEHLSRAGNGAVGLSAWTNFLASRPDVEEPTEPETPETPETPES